MALTLTVGSMFAGIGGFDLGAEHAGMRVLWAVEKDESARKLLRAQFPDLEVLEDVTTVDPGGLRRTDVLTAGWPCQDVSVAGNRAGLAGERSGLWREVVRWLGVLRPTWFVGENVPGLLSSAGGRDMGTVLGQLGDCGYGWAYRIVDARYFGVAQRRRRVLIVGCLGDPARAAEVLLEPEGREWHPASRREAGQDVAGTLGGGSGERGWAPDTDRMTFVPEVGRPLTAHPSGSRLDGESDQFVVAPPLMAGAGSNHNSPGFGRDEAVVVAHTLRSEGADASEDGTGRGTPLVLAYQVHGETSNGSGAVETEVARTLDGQGFSGGRGGTVVGIHANQRGDVRTSGLSGSLNGSHSGKQYEGAHDGSAVRRLLPVECERLQGFPDGWTEGFSDSTRYKMLGNAICVNVAEWVLRRAVTQQRGKR